jgi:hypothetical protein
VGCVVAAIAAEAETKMAAKESAIVLREIIVFVL